MLVEQKKTVGLNQGAIPGKTGSKGEPVLDPRPTLSDAGIDKNLSSRAPPYERYMARPRRRRAGKRKSGSLLTPRWRKADSNSWSHLWMRVSLGETGRK
jgi:hypothetical protein